MSFYSDVMSSDMYESALWKELTDKNGNEISVALSMVGEIPTSRMLKTQFSIDETAELIIKLPENLVRTYCIEDVNEHDNYYYIDYKRDYIYFSKNLVYQTFLIRYYGTRFEAISANKIFTNIDNTGQPTEFLDNILNSVHDVVEVCKKINNLPDLIDTLETKEENLTNQIETIEQDTVTATQVNKILNTTKNQAVQTNKDLIESNNLATNIIDTIKEKTDIGNNLVNTLSSKITDSINVSNTLTNNTSLANSSIKNLQELIPKGQDLVKDIKNPDYFYKSIPSENFTKNNDTGMYEYNMSHNLNTDKYDISLWDTDGNQIVNLGEKIDNNTYKIVNDEKIDIIAVCGNKGSWNGTT